MRHSLGSGIGAVVLAALVAGSIGAAPKKPAAKAAAKPSPAEIAAGKKVFETSGCQGCHKVAGKGGASGPDLSKIGKEHDMAWIAKKVKDPKSTNKSSIMPPFAGSPKDLQAVAAYMASLK
jgi:mono/diheme cytochrome c family protein